MGSLFDKLKSLFSTSQIEVCMVGLENSGKTTLLNQLSLGDPKFTVPTVGLNVKTVKKSGVSMKVTMIEINLVFIITDIIMIILVIKYKGKRNLKLGRSATTIDDCH